MEVEEGTQITGRKCGVSLVNMACMKPHSNDDGEDYNYGYVPRFPAKRSVKQQRKTPTSPFRQPPSLRNARIGAQMLMLIAQHGGISNFFAEPFSLAEQGFDRLSESLAKPYSLRRWRVDPNQRHVLCRSSSLQLYRRSQEYSSGGMILTRYISLLTRLPQ